MNIFLFGGAFDPPHLGHQQIVTSLIEQQLADQVWLVPTGQHQFDKSMLPAEHRLEMIERLEQNLPQDIRKQVKTEKFEIENSGPSRSYLTLQRLSQRNPEDNFFWVIGSDNLSQFHRWYQYQQLLTEFLVYVYPRRGYPMQPLYTGMVPLVGVEQIAVSSRLVRNKLQRGENLEAVMAPSVLEYIQQQGLYR